MKLQPIPNFSEYFATKEGEIWSNKTNKYLKGGTDICGYRQYSLMKNNKIYHYRGHVLILETFIGPCPLGMECRHLDGNRQNNNLSNLCWGTHKENVADTIKHGNISKGEKHSYNLTQNDVDFIRWVALFNVFTHLQLTKYFPVSRRQISRIISNQSWRI